MVRLFIYFDVTLSIITCLVRFFFLMIRRPPRSTLDRSSAASDVYKRQVWRSSRNADNESYFIGNKSSKWYLVAYGMIGASSVSYTHLRAHETVLDLVCRLLLEKKNTIQTHSASILASPVYYDVNTHPRQHRYTYLLVNIPNQ